MSRQGFASMPVADARAFGQLAECASAMTSSPLTTAELERLRAIAAAAPKRPVAPDGPRIRRNGPAIAVFQRPADAALFATAMNSFARLVDEVTRLRAEAVEQGEEVRRLEEAAKGLVTT